MRYLVICIAGGLLLAALDNVGCEVIDSRVHVGHVGSGTSVVKTEEGAAHPLVDCHYDASGSEVLFLIPATLRVRKMS